MDAVRQSLASAIDGLFLLAAIIGVVGLVVVLFLREDPLRRTHLTIEQREMLAGRGRVRRHGRFLAGGLGRGERAASPSSPSSWRTTT